MLGHVDGGDFQVQLCGHLGTRPSLIDQKLKGLPGFRTDATLHPGPGLLVQLEHELWFQGVRQAVAVFLVVQQLLNVGVAAAPAGAAAAVAQIGPSVPGQSLEPTTEVSFGGVRGPFSAPLATMQGVLSSGSSGRVVGGG